VWSWVLLFVDKYFTAVTCFLLFNVCAMCGSLIAAVCEMVILFCEFLGHLLRLVSLKVASHMSSFCYPVLSPHRHHPLSMCKKIELFCQMILQMCLVSM